MLIAIWAMDKNQLIGNNNKLPWLIPSEMKHFQNTTINNDILVGRLTFQSFGNRPLPNRNNYVATKQKTLKFNNSNVHIVHNINEFIKKYQNKVGTDLYVCGGAQIYKTLWNKFDHLIVSVINQSFQGDIFFPKVNWNLFIIKKVIKNDIFNIVHYYRNK